MKTVGYTALRYGADYLGWAIRSIIDNVDEHHILYATRPSHGHWSDVPCPDSEDELREIAWQAAGSKLKWHRGDWLQEGQQRNSILEYAPDADVILTLDSDEIWPEGMAEKAISRTIQYPTIRYFRAEMIHYWRSFYKCVLHDPAYPARVINPRGTDDKLFYVDAHRMNYVDGVDHRLMINHMGYATTPEIVAYKWQIHGHKNELRTDVNWFKDVFMANRQTDCHPVGSEHWNPEPVNPLDYMPHWMEQHPFFDKEVIE